MSPDCLKVRLPFSGKVTLQFLAELCAPACGRTPAEPGVLGASPGDWPAHLRLTDLQAGQQRHYPRCVLAGAASPSRCSGSGMYDLLFPGSRMASLFRTFLKCRPGLLAGGIGQSGHNRFQGRESQNLGKSHPDLYSRPCRSSSQSTKRLGIEHMYLFRVKNKASIAATAMGANIAMPSGV